MYTHILMPVDLDQTASWEKALPVVVEMCRTFGTRLTVMTAIPGFTMSVVEQYFPPDALDRMTADAEAGLEAFVREQVPDGVTVETVFATGNIYHEIIGTAQKSGADLIVMGSHSPALKDYLLGPNAARVVRHAPVSVLVVR